MAQRFSYAKGGKLVLHTFYVGTLLSFYFDTVSFVDKERYIYPVDTHSRSNKELAKIQTRHKFQDDYIVRLIAWDQL